MKSYHWLTFGTDIIGNLRSESRKFRFWGLKKVNISWRGMPPDPPRREHLWCSVITIRLFSNFCQLLEKFSWLTQIKNIFPYFLLSFTLKTAYFEMFPWRFKLSGIYCTVHMCIYIGTSCKIVWNPGRAMTCYKQWLCYVKNPTKNYINLYQSLKRYRLYRSINKHRYSQLFW